MSPEEPWGSSRCYAGVVGQQEKPLPSKPIDHRCLLRKKLWPQPCFERTGAWSEYKAFGQSMSTMFWKGRRLIVALQESQSAFQEDPEILENMEDLEIMPWTILGGGWKFGRC